MAGLLLTGQVRGAAFGAADSSILAAHQMLIAAGMPVRGIRSVQGISGNPDAPASRPTGAGDTSHSTYQCLKNCRSLGYEWVSHDLNLNPTYSSAWLALDPDADWTAYNAVSGSAFTAVPPAGVGNIIWAACLEKVIDRMMMVYECADLAGLPRESLHWVMGNNEARNPGIDHTYHVWVSAATNAGATSVPINRAYNAAPASGAWVSFMDPATRRCTFARAAGTATSPNRIELTDPLPSDIAFGSAAYFLGGGTFPLAISAEQDAYFHYMAGGIKEALAGVSGFNGLRARTCHGTWLENELSADGTNPQYVRIQAFIEAHKAGREWAKDLQGFCANVYPNVNYCADYAPGGGYARIRRGPSDGNDMVLRRLADIRTIIASYAPFAHLATETVVTETGWTVNGLGRGEVPSGINAPRFSDTSQPDAWLRGTWSGRLMRALMASGDCKYATYYTINGDDAGSDVYEDSGLTSSTGSAWASLAGMCSQFDPSITMATRVPSGTFPLGGAFANAGEAYETPAIEA